MKRSFIYLMLISLFFSCAEKSKKTTVEQTGPLQTFPLQEVRLLDSPFKNAQDVDMEYILKLDVDRLLAPYLREAGLKPKAESYGNWENTGLDGHIGGHYLSALSMMYASTGDPRMKERMDYMLQELKKCQDSFGDGYLAGIPGGYAMWKDIANGKINAGAFSLNDKWVPLYNIHKIYAGLRDAYLYGGSELAKEMLIKLSDWAIKLVSKLSEDQVQEMLKSEHGGLNEVFADVAVITGDQKYIKLAREFSDLSILNPLLQKKDELTGKHANTQIPKVIGYKRIADVTGDKSWSDAARFFWEDVIDLRTVSIGGNSVREHFHPVDDYSSMLESEQGPETCNTYNMLKLTKMLFLTDPASKYMDYYERALYNHILSTEDPVRGGFVYFTPMRPGHYRVYSQAQTCFWCCVGSGLENHTKYGMMIYSHADDDLYVNLFIPSKLDWKEKGIKITQKSDLPFNDQVTLTVNTDKESAFKILIRDPKWVKSEDISVTVNGEKVDFEVTANHYLVVDREWKDNDVVKLKLPMHLSYEQIPDKEHYYSFYFGPFVLAAKTDTMDMPGEFADDSRGGHIAAGKKIPLQDIPVVISNEKDLLSHIVPVKGKKATFAINSLRGDKYKNLELVPFYEIYESRYIVYFPVETEDSYADIQKKLAEDEAARLALEKQTVDMLYPGEQQPESDHFVKSVDSRTGEYEGKHWRDATSKGWFSYEFKDKHKEAKKLRVMYCGYNGGRKFSIEINGTKIQDVTLENNSEIFYTIDYTIPAEVIKKSKGVLTVKFTAAENSTAGGIFELRLLR